MMNRNNKRTRRIRRLQYSSFEPRIALAADFGAAVNLSLQFGGDNSVYEMLEVSSSHSDILPAENVAESSSTTFWNDIAPHYNVNSFDSIDNDSFIEAIDFGFTNFETTSFEPFIEDIEFGAPTFFNDWYEIESELDSYAELDPHSEWDFEELDHEALEVFDDLMLDDPALFEPQAEPEFVAEQTTIEPEPVAVEEPNFQPSNRFDSLSVGEQGWSFVDSSFSNTKSLANIGSFFGVTTATNTHETFLDQVNVSPTLSQTIAVATPENIPILQVVDSTTPDSLVTVSETMNIERETPATQVQTVRIPANELATNIEVVASTVATVQSQINFNTHTTGEPQTEWMTPRIRELGSQILSSTNAGLETTSDQPARQTFRVLANQFVASGAEFSIEHTLNVSNITEAQFSNNAWSQLFVGVPLEPLEDFAGFDVFAAISIETVEETRASSHSVIGWSVASASLAGSIGWFVVRDRITKPTARERVRKQQTQNAYDQTVRATVQWTGL